MLKKSRTETQIARLAAASRRVSAPAYAHSWQKRKARAKLRRLFCKNEGGKSKSNELQLPLLRDKNAA